MRDVPSVPVPGDGTADMLDRLPALRQGAAGFHVRTLQGLLRARGYDMAIDGRFGPVTRRAVEEEQAGRGLPADGNVDRPIWIMLITGDLP